MPFLTKRTTDRSVDSTIFTSSRQEGAHRWTNDIYKSHISDNFHVASQERSCANMHCLGGWTPPWRSRHRPIFEGQWGCGGRCILAIVQAAVRREIADAGVIGRTPHRHRVPLGLLMLGQGWISQEQLQRALDVQRIEGRGRIGEWLMSECGLDPERVTRGLSMQWGCPVLGVDGFQPEAMALVMPKVLMEQFGLLPLRVAGSSILYLASSTGLDASLALGLERMTGLRVENGVIQQSQFEAAKKALLACTAVETKQEILADNDTMAARITALLERARPIASRIVRVHQYCWFRMWLEPGAQGRTGSLPMSSEDMIDYVFSIGPDR